MAGNIEFISAPEGGGDVGICRQSDRKKGINTKGRLLLQVCCIISHFGTRLEPRNGPVSGSGPAAPCRVSVASESGDSFTHWITTEDTSEAGAQKRRAEAWGALLRVCL